MKEYFKYFRVLYIIFAVMLVITCLVGGMRFFASRNSGVRGNDECPKERVYDYADVMTDAEEEKLRKKIEKTEAEIECDLVIVTINMSVLDYYGFTSNTDENWEDAMMNYADDFYDQNLYGYDKVHGDGALLLDNWYKEGTDDSEAGSWLSTCGEVYETYSMGMIDDLLDDVYDRVDYSPYMAYEAYIDHISLYMGGSAYSGGMIIPFGGCLIISLIPAIIFVVTHLKSKEGKKTTTQNTYMDTTEGNAVFKVRKDDLIDKRVTSVRIQTSSSGGGSSRSGGRGGSHRSSGGVRHGGGGRRR